MTSIDRNGIKRPNGYLVAAFTEGVPLESILRLAEADERYDCSPL